jgi:hypothetical protein
MFGEERCQTDSRWEDMLDLEPVTPLGTPNRAFRLAPNDGDARSAASLARYTERSCNRGLDPDSGRVTC